MLDARLHHKPGHPYVIELIDMARSVAGSRNKLAAVVGISRRRLGYIESGNRVLPTGRVIPVVITFAEQVTLESIINIGRK